MQKQTNLTESQQDKLKKYLKPIVEGILMEIGYNPKTEPPKAVKTLSVPTGDRINIEKFPNFHKSGNIKGMKERYYGKGALLVKCGDYIYNVSSQPDIYFKLAR
jgi:hypothetical protein